MSSIIIVAAALLLSSGSTSLQPYLDDTVDLWHYCRQHFEHEFDAFVNADADDDTSGYTAKPEPIDPFASFVQLCGQQIAHQHAALADIERVLRQHRTRTDKHRTTHRGFRTVSNIDNAASMALLGGSGTGKSLTVGILMREWLLHGYGNVVHYVWPFVGAASVANANDDDDERVDEEAAIRHLQLPAVRAQTIDQLSRYEPNVLVVDGIPGTVGHAAAVRRYHSEVVRIAHEQRYLRQPLLVVYVLNVWTASVREDALGRLQPLVQDVGRRIDGIRAELLRPAAVVAAAEIADNGVAASSVVPIVYESLRSSEQLRECIDVERQRLRLPAEAVTEAHVELIGAGIDVRQSGCKHVSARMAMYVVEL